MNDHGFQLKIQNSTDVIRAKKKERRKLKIATRTDYVIDVEWEHLNDTSAKDAEKQIPKVKIDHSFLRS